MDADNRNKQEFDNNICLNVAKCVSVGVVLIICFSFQEMYSKGLILVSAIRQIKGLGDNKFEVVTGLRTFTFRAEKEGKSP